MPSKDYKYVSDAALQRALRDYDPRFTHPQEQKPRNQGTGLKHTLKVKGNG